MPHPAQPLAVLMYHSVGGGAPKSVHAGMFESQIAWLVDSKSGYTTIDWRGLPILSDWERAVLLTFDDGYSDNLAIVSPIMCQYGVRGIFFVNTGYLEGKNDLAAEYPPYRGLKPLNWGQVERLMALGHTIGMHGHSHKSLGKMSFNEAVDDISASAKIFKRRLGVVPDVFAYPFGQPVDQRDDLNGVFYDLGIKAIFTTENRLASMHSLGRCADEMQRVLPRIAVEKEDTLQVFTDKISGRWDFLSFIQRARAKS